MAYIKLSNKYVGEGYPTYIIAEMSANHGGSYNRAVEIIHAAKDSGADCIKLQTSKPEMLTLDSDKDYFKIDKGLWKGNKLIDLYKSTYTPWEWHELLKKEAEKLGLDFFSSPFGKEAVDFLESIGVGFYKIASFEMVDIPLVKYIASKGKPIIMSTGMASLEEIEEAVNAIKSMGNEEICLLRCSSAYPAIPDDMNLRTIEDMYNKFNVPIGLSDHSFGDIAAIVSVSLGAKVIEKHLCLDREIKTPDSEFSMEPNEFKKMVDNIRLAEKALGKVSYDVSEYEKTSKVFRRSIFVSRTIEVGEFFTTDNVRIIRPAYGLEPKHYESILGKRATKKIQKGTPLKWDMIK